MWRGRREERGAAKATPPPFLSFGKHESPHRGCQNCGSLQNCGPHAPTFWAGGSGIRGRGSNPRSNCTYGHAADPVHWHVSCACANVNLKRTTNSTAGAVMHKWAHMGFSARKKSALQNMQESRPWILLCTKSMAETILSTKIGFQNHYESDVHHFRFGCCLWFGIGVFLF